MKSIPPPVRLVALTLVASTVGLGAAPSHRDDDVPSPNNAVEGSCVDGFAASAARPLPSPIHVHDDVFNSQVCDGLRVLAHQHDRYMGGSDVGSYFVRPPTLGGPPLTPLERAIDSVLSAVGDDCPYVEYWSRDWHKNIEAHVDLDEIAHEDDEDALHHPDWGHVLYLGNGKEAGASPTVVFPDRLMGWDGASKKESTTGERRRASRELGVEMVIVPSVKGRLLRFDGRAMHAVPRPADRWLQSDGWENHLRRKIEDDDDDYYQDISEEEDGDDDYYQDISEEEDDNDNDDITEWHGEDMTHFYQRKKRWVLLFNTWRDSPPKGVEPVDPIPEGLLSDMQEHFGLDFSNIHCNNVSEWREAKMHLTETLKLSDNRVGTDNAMDKSIPVRVNLMGDKHRCLHPSNRARLQGPPEMREGLMQPNQVSRFVLFDDEE